MWYEGGGGDRYNKEIKGDAYAYSTYSTHSTFRMYLFLFIVLHGFAYAFTALYNLFYSIQFNAPWIRCHPHVSHIHNERVADISQYLDFF